MLPEHLTYTRSHEWCLIDGEHATVGVTPHALKGLGNLVCIGFPDIDDDVLHDVPFGEIEGTRNTKDVFSSVDGVVTEINGRVAHNPDLLTKDPYKQAWLIRLKLVPHGRRGEMLSAPQYQRILANKR